MRITKYRKSLKLSRVKAGLLVFFLALLTGNGYAKFEPGQDNLFRITLNGQYIGTVSEADKAEELLWKARREIAGSSQGLVFVETELSVTGEEMLYGYVDAEEDVYQAMVNTLHRDEIQVAERSYTLKMDEYMVNLSSLDEVRQLLQAAIHKYDENDQFAVRIITDDNREFNALTIEIADTTKETQSREDNPMVGGILSEMDRMQVYEEEKTGFDDFELGVMAMSFTDEVEIVEAYLPKDQLDDLDQAIEEVTMEQATKTIYTVGAGDTLSEIAIKVNIPMDQIVAMNDSLEDERTTIRVGQELVITIPEPAVSVQRQEVNYYEEIYDAPVIYVDNDSWYTNQSVVKQQPSAGMRKIVAKETFLNETMADREILMEELVMEAVPKIIERGTKVPPTYIKPLSGGRKSSGFGPRSAPTKGASTYHKGVDWATPIGTTIVASCGGTVEKAGWGSGYGYVVYIKHEDGRQTRYGHLSKVLVKVGDKVKQGDKIALSGNTGITSGPHVHFEILINGKQVDPEKYINK